ncbi:MAG: uridine kinase [Erysipelotrichaceae bacterium]|nr:uridine kinase [Erysipelotrichaceae bacterium]
MKKPVLIGIAGGSASGKTSVSRRIQQEFGDTNTVLIIRQDDYYKDQSDMTMEERTKVNYDHPFAFDNDLFVAQLKQLMNHQAIEKPTYDFVQLTRSPLTEHCEPADVIVVEGLFVLEDEQIRSLLNIKVFIDAPADVRFIRRLMRDVKERGRNLDWVVDQYLGTVRPMHDIFIEPSKRYADIIIPQGGQNEVAVDLLNTKIASIIHHPLD